MLNCCPELETRLKQWRNIPGHEKKSVDTSADFLLKMIQRTEATLKASKDDKMQLNYHGSNDTEVAASILCATPPARY